MFIINASNAQTITSVGSSNTFEVATWNIEWFGSPSELPSNDDLQRDNAVRVITESGIDLWGVQEISNTSAFNALLDALGPNFDGQLATNSGTQRIGYIYNTDVIRVRQVRHVLESFQSEFAFRPPLQMEVDVMLPDTTVTVTLIVVHMKANADPDSYNRRVQASTRLKSHIDFSTLAGEPVIVLGDMNDRLTRSIFGNRTSPYRNFLDDTANYEFLSYPLEMDGFGSFCSNSSCSSAGSMIDHILITDELFAAGTASNPYGVLNEASDEIVLFGSSTSDHLPVYARFDFKTQVSNEPEDDIPSGFTISAPYPNPVQNESRLSYQLSIPSAVRLQLFDVTGRMMISIEKPAASPGTYEEVLNMTDYASGMYFLRALINGESRMFAIFRQ